MPGGLVPSEHRSQFETFVTKLKEAHQVLSSVGGEHAEVHGRADCTILLETLQQLQNTFGYRRAIGKTASVRLALARVRSGTKAILSQLEEREWEWVPLHRSAWNNFVQGSNSLLRLFLRPANTATQMAAESRGRSARRRRGPPQKYDPNNDARIVDDWKASGLHRPEFERNRGLKPGAVRSAQDRIKARKSAGE